MESRREINLNLVILAVLILSLGLIARKEVQFRETHQSSFVSQAPASSPLVKVPVKVTEPMPQEGLAQIEKDLQVYIKLEEGGLKTLERLTSKREKMLKSASQLRNLRSFLSRTPTDAREAAEQNAGFALLLEGAHGDHAEEATETLRMIVADQEMDDILSDGEGGGRRVQSESDDVIGLSPRFLRDRLQVHPAGESSASIGQ